MDFVAAKRLMDAALDSVLGNFWTALKVTLLPLFIFAILVLVMFFQNIVGGLAANEGAPSAFGLKVVIAALAGALLFYSAAVNWHRAILLPPDQRSLLPVAETFKYLLKSVGATLFFVLIGLMIVVPTSFITGAGVRISIGDFVGAYHQGWFQVVLTAALTWGFWFWYLSVSPSLVQAALGRKEGIFAAFNRSLEHVEITCGLATIMTLCMLAYSVAGAGLPALPPVLMAVVEVGVLWLVFVFSISLLTQFHKLCAADAV
ncbi:hypothetical protein NBRC116594_35600 [Shimia sp. NS0008-38b]|uniref:hypothetical protein n=1 Tax=Shimia sp. NS0008-38b TaxID=3127653 RepID=UPI003105815B